MRFYIGRWERYLADAELARIDAIEEGGLGRYNTFTHYDRRGNKARWDNRTK